jgi:acyl-CoA hydrolase
MEKQLKLRFLAEPSDVNFGGKVHGGAVMKWIDQAGYACAVNWCNGYAVTVYVSGIQFYEPILIGHLVELRARIVHTGKTSMHIAVDVYSKALASTTYVHNTHCIVIFVGLDQQGEPREVPHFEASGDEEKKWQAYAIKLMGLRKDIAEEMRTFRQDGA